MSSDPEKPPTGSRLRSVACSALLVIVVLIAFGPLLKCEFTTWDDTLWVAGNPELHHPGLAALGRFWRDPFAGLYVPVTFTVWTGLARLSFWVAPNRDGLHPGVFHAANVAVHALCVLVVFALLRRVFGESRKAEESNSRTVGKSKSKGGARSHRPTVPSSHSLMVPSLLGALLFALHPVQVESVGWVCGLKDLLGGLFCLLAVHQFLGFAGSLGRDVPVSRVIRAGLLANLAYGLALLSKPSTVVTPLLALAVLMFAVSVRSDARPRRRQWYAVAGLLAGWLLLAVPIVYYGRKFQHLGPVFRPPLPIRPLLAGDAVSFYVYRLFWPARLAFDYGRLPKFVLAQSWRWLTGPLPYVAVVGLWLARRRAGWLFWAAGVFGVALLPVLGFLPFQFQQYSTTADHYLYVAMLGPALIVVWLIDRYGRRAVLLGAVLLVVLGIRTMLQTRVWHDSETLYEHALRVNPRSWVSHNNLGLLRKEAGRRDGALRHHKTAVALKPYYVEAHTNLGVLYREAGDNEAARRAFERALEIQPKDANALTNLGLIHADRGDNAAALACYELALKGEPDHVEARVNRGNVFYAQGDMAAAGREYERALSRIATHGPRRAQVLKNLGLVHYSQARYDAALRLWEEALAIMPDDGSIRKCVRAGQAKIRAR